jgi:hypothetical protein
VHRDGAARAGRDGQLSVEHGDLTLPRRGAQAAAAPIQAYFTDCRAGLGS